ncbi:g12828 [Coccomyxa viridis]|uniref:G12828 protein n=1 Tax=Coccomyxa viridis TaxID=1274662 RepID=A0ABP1GCE2_9CHLO
MTESSLQLPRQEAFLLEFPGFVKNAQPALDSFGGEDAVSELLAGTRQALQLRLRPGDPLAHPILGLKQQTQGLLLRLSSKAGQGRIDGNAGVQAEVVAHVKRCVRFSGMADFQYASCTHLPQGAEAALPAGLPGFEPEPLLTPPQLFTKQDVPLDYSFRSYYGSDPDHFKTGVAAGKGVGRMAGHVISFESLHVLQPAEQTGAAGPAEEVGLKMDRRQMLRAAAALFSRQAIRSQQDVQSSVAGLTGQDADIVLPRLAYMFRNGPWKGLWVKRGYDPRTDPASAERQALQLPGRGRGGAGKQAASNSLYQQICRLSALPDNSTALPVGDLQETSVASLLAGAKRLPKCDVNSGWFSEENWKKLQHTVSACLQKLSPDSRSTQAGSVGLPAGQPGPSETHQQQAPGGMNAGANTSTAEQSAQDTQISMQSEDVHMSSQAANREGQQMQHAQGKEAKGNMGGAAHMPDSSAEKLAQGGLLPDALLQGLLGVRGGDAAAARFSQEAAQALRAGVQEDFELFEASDNEDEMEEGTANESQGGDDQEEDDSEADEE